MTPILARHKPLAKGHPRPISYKSLGMRPAKKRPAVHFNPCHDERGRFCSTGGGVVPDNLPQGPGIRQAFSKAEPYMKQGDITAVRLLDDQSFRAISGVNPGDVAFRDSQTGEMFINELGLKMQSNPARVIAHEIGHGVMGRNIKAGGYKNEQSLIRFWERGRLSLSGIQQHNPSEGLAEIFAIRVTEPGRFSRIFGSRSREQFDRLLGVAGNRPTTHSKPGARPRLVLVNGLLAHQASNRTDPTKTTGLRNRWAAEMGRRFAALRRLIWKAIVQDDVFGLGPPYILFRPTIYAELTSPGVRKFDFPLLQEKIAPFMEWLREQEKLGILETITIPRLGQSLGTPWTDIFIKDSYQRGVSRARYELTGAGWPVPTLEATGGLVASMSTPFHVDRLASMYLRAFDGLKGITSAMDTQISHVLAQGLADGDNPLVLAKKMNYVISGMGEDLGIIDSLGRFIPAERRARMLARTEVIRSHAVASLQEYKVWGVVGVDVVAEWTTAGFNVCPLCLELARKGPYTIEQAMGMIPAHPHCLLDRQTPIYTSEGWKPIGKVKVGDLVLTHKARFRKVYGLPRTPGQNPEAVRFYIKSVGTLSVTSNHLVQVCNDKLPPHWKEASKVTVNDRIMLLANECARCAKPIPYTKKYCSRRCCSLDITDRQWANPEHRRNISEKNRKSMIEQYTSGRRDRFEITKGMNNKARQMVKAGIWGWWQDEEFFEKVRQVTNTPEHRQASSERMKRKNPLHDPVAKAKMAKSLIENYRKNPERRLNALMAKHRKSKKMTLLEKKMAGLLDRLGIEYVFQYPILRYDVDFAIPALRIVIECDGTWWHKDKEYDLKRQKKIEAEGWFVLRYDDKKINDCLDEVGDELQRVLMNHASQYKFVACQIRKIEKWTVRGNPRMLYNLAVEEDESYLAKGAVVHNCRCAWRPRPAEKVS